MKLHYSSERREQIGSLNRGKSLSTITIEKMRESALKRGTLSAESRALVSAHSRMAYYWYVSKLNLSEFLDNEGNIFTLLTFRSIASLSKFCKVSIKTIQRAIRRNGVVTAVQSITLI